MTFQLTSPLPYGLDDRRADYWPTPAWVTEALLDSDVAPPTVPVLEPAAGDGAIVRVLRSRGYAVDAVELREEEREHLEAARCQSISIGDWLQVSAGLSTSRRAIVTNPPFSIALPFARACLTVGAVYVALLLPVTSLAGAAAAWGPFWRDHPPTALRPLRRRPRFAGNGTDRVGVTWVIWQQGRPCLDLVPV